jgi:serine/threonine protein kinase
MLLLGKPIEASTMGRADDSRVTVTLEVGRILGGGCNGLVRLATDVQTGRQYALKILNKVQMVTAAEHVFQEQKVCDSLFAAPRPANVCRELEVGCRPIGATERPRYASAGGPRLAASPLDWRGTLVPST